MKITYFMVANYMLDCTLIGTKPCKYFQLNSEHFNQEKGIFSKLDLDRMIPKKWRLPQRYDDGLTIPAQYPVFLKPEWSENANGIFRADNDAELATIRRNIKNRNAGYLIQQGAPESREFEIFSLQQPKDKTSYSVFSITEVCNKKEINPINSIYNPATRYRDITETLSESQKKTLWHLLEEIGRFAISRLSVRSDSIDNLLNGKFHVIELNLFTPMPIHVIDVKYSWFKKCKMVMKYMLILARVTKHRDKTLKEKSVYTKLYLYNRQSAIATFIKERL